MASQLQAGADSLLHEKSVFPYPHQALREFVINAVLHRSYESTGPVRVYWFSDRVEIQSPGGLYGEASPENFPNRNSYRNPVLAEALKTLGFMSCFGMGVERALAALLRNGNPFAEFRFDPGYVQVTPTSPPCPTAAATSRSSPKKIARRCGIDYT